MFVCLFELNDRVGRDFFFVYGELQLLLGLNHGGSKDGDALGEMLLDHLLLLGEFLLQVGHAPLV